MLVARRRGEERATLVLKTEIPDNNEEGYMRYESNAVGLTFNIDMKRKRHWRQFNDVKRAQLGVGRQKDFPQYYPAHADEKVAIKLLPKMPGFIHLKTSLSRIKGEPAHVAMAVNGLSVPDAWRCLKFIGMIQDAGRHTSPQDSPVCSILRGGMQTVRNTGPFDIDALDDIAFVPPQMRLVERFGAGKQITFMPRRTGDNGLFILMPVPVKLAVRFVIELDDEYDGQILRGLFDLKEKKDDEEPADEEKKEEKERKDTGAATHGSGVSGRREDTSSQLASSSSSSSSSHSDFSDALSSLSSAAPSTEVCERTSKTKKDKARTASSCDGGEEPQTKRPKGTPEHEAARERAARKLIISRFFAGRALHAAAPGANFTLEIHGTQYG